MFVKSLFIAASLFVGVVSVSQAAVLSNSSHGTIIYGYDGLGIFGGAGANLAGLSYELAMNFNGSSNQTYNDNYYGYTNNNGAALTTYNVMVNNVSYTTTSDTWGQQYIANSLSQPTGYSYRYDQLYAQAYGYTPTSQWVQGYHYVYSYSNAFVGPNRDLNASYSRKVANGDQAYAYFEIYDSNWNNYTYWEATVSKMALNGSTKVPEPATLALVSLGLLGVAARRKLAATKKI